VIRNRPRIPAERRPHLPGGKLVGHPVVVLPAPATDTGRHSGRPTTSRPRVSSPLPGRPPWRTPLWPWPSHATESDLVFARSRLTGPGPTTIPAGSLAYVQGSSPCPIP
jgi:hypothetical protein